MSSVPVDCVTPCTTARTTSALPTSSVFSPLGETNDAVYVPGFIPERAITTESPLALSSSMDAVPTEGRSAFATCGTGVAVGGTGVAVGGTGVAVGGTGVAVGGTGVAVGGGRLVHPLIVTEVTVCGTGVAVGGTGVAVGGTGVAVGGTGVAVGGTGVAVDGTATTAAT